MFDGDWNTYGGEVGPEWVTMYYQRLEVGRFPSVAEFRHPLLILADLALDGKEPRTTDHADMQTTTSALAENGVGVAVIRALLQCSSY